MFHVYIIFSKTANKFYIGVTSNLEERIKKHNAKNKGFTNQASDWECLYTEVYIKKSDALKREREIKKWKSRKKILSLINNIV